MNYKKVKMKFNLFFNNIYINYNNYETLIKYFIISF